MENKSDLVSFSESSFEKRNERIIEKYSALIQEAKSQKEFWDLLHRYLKVHKREIEVLEVSIDKFLGETGI
jgi:hypothetical protein